MTNRRINELIAEHIMGLELDRGKDGTYDAVYIYKTAPNYTLCRPIPDYCTDIKLAFGVVEKIGDIKVSANTKDCFGVDYIDGYYHVGWGFNTSLHKSLPMAIALAAIEIIRARGIEVD
jgi:hypothetical protein